MSQGGVVDARLRRGEGPGKVYYELSLLQAAGHFRPCAAKAGTPGPPGSERRSFRTPSKVGKVPWLKADNS